MIWIRAPINVSHVGANIASRFYFIYESDSLFRIIYFPKLYTPVILSIEIYSLVEFCKVKVVMKITGAVFVWVYFGYEAGALWSAI